MSETRRIHRVGLEGVSKRFGRQHALKKVSLHFEGGTVTGIAGPNGAGKSTLLRLLSTLMFPSKGTLRFGDLGSPAGGDLNGIRRQIGYLGHQSGLYRHMTGKENLRFFAKLSGQECEEMERSVEQALEAVDMADVGDRLVGECSRGMIQRLALARLIVQRTHIWLLDEPTTGLDGESRASVVGLIREKAALGGIVVVVSHDEAFLEEVSHRVVRLIGGRVDLQGEGAS